MPDCAVLSKNEREKVWAEAEALERQAVDEPKYWVRAACRWKRLGEVDRAIAALYQNSTAGKSKLSITDAATYINFHRGSEAAVEYLKTTLQNGGIESGVLVSYFWRLGDEQKANEIIDSSRKWDGLEFERVTHLLCLNRKVEALEYLDRVSSRDDMSHEYIAMFHAFAGDPEIADFHFNEITDWNDHQLRVYAKFLERQGNDDAALAVYRQVITDLVPDERWVWREHNPVTAAVGICLRRGDIDGARQLLDESLLESKLLTVPVYVEFLLLQNEPDAAVVLLSNVLNDSELEASTRGDWQGLLATAYIQQGKVEEAFHTYVDAIENNIYQAKDCLRWLQRIRRTDLFDALGEVLKQKSTEASARYKALRSAPTPSVRLDGIEIELGDLRDEWFLQADETHVRSFYYNESFEQAAALGEELVKLGNVSTYELLYDVYKSMNNERRIAEMREDSFIVDVCEFAPRSRAMNCYRNEQWRLAGEHFRLYAETDPVSPGKELLLAAECFVKAGEVEMAIDSFERARLVEFSLGHEDRSSLVTGTIPSPMFPKNMTEYIIGDGNPRPRREPVAVVMSRYLESIGRFGDAERVLVEECDRNVEAFVPLARLRVKTGKLHAAMNAYQEAVKYGPLEVGDEVEALAIRLSSATDEVKDLRSPEANQKPPDRSF